MNIEEQTNRMSYSDRSAFSGELDGLQIIRVPVGTFAGTQERLLLVPDGELAGFERSELGQRIQR
jgi:hypothetical protein